MGLFKRSDHHHPDPKVRLKAVEELTGPEELVEVATTDDSPRVRMAALERVSEDEHLGTIAKDAKELDVRLAAVERIRSEQLLAEIIKVRKNYALMGACFSRITNRKVLEAIAEDTDYNPAARRMAVDQFADESYLDEVSRASAEEEREPTSEATIDALLTSFDDVTVVRAIGRFRRSEKALQGLGMIARRGGETGGLAVEYLVRALGSSNPELRQTAIEQLATVRSTDAVATIVRAFDDPKLHEPIREVLQRIDTPQARAALGEADAPTGQATS